MDVLTWLNDLCCLCSDAAVQATESLLAPINISHYNTLYELFILFCPITGMQQMFVLPRIIPPCAAIYIFKIIAFNRFEAMAINKLT